VLVILAAGVAACSRNDAATEGTDALAQDRALIARLEVDQETRQQPLPAACGTVALAAQPALANQQQARELTRQARDAEMQGNVKEARALLIRASELDGTNKSTAYHLGRTNEALGDRTAAIAAYCRYLALTPTTPEAVEAHQRLSKLSQTVTRVAGGSVVDSTPTARKAPIARAASVAPAPAPAPARRVARERPKAAPRVVASAPVERRAPAPSREREPSPASVSTSGAEVASASSEPAVTPREADSSNGGTTAGGDVVATTGAGQASTQQPAVEQPSTAPRTSRRVPSRAQSAGIGAGMGAIIGAATGRSVKSAVIGAAAGGILGTMVGSGMSPIGRSITPYAPGGR
jgi:hypothetical protein